MPLPFMIAPAIIAAAHGPVRPVGLDAPCDSTVASHGNPPGLLEGSWPDALSTMRYPTCPFFARGGYGRAMGALHPPSFARLCLHHKPGLVHRQAESSSAYLWGKGRVHDWLAEGNMTNVLLLGSWRFLSATMRSSGQTTRPTIPQGRYKRPLERCHRCSQWPRGMWAGLLWPYFYSI